jgi:hypothetical protein
LWLPFAVKYPFFCGSVLNRNNQGATTRDCPYGRFVGASQGECPLPLNTGLFVVQYLPHLDPNHKNSLCDFIKKLTTIPVFEVQNAMPIKPNFRQKFFKQILLK